MKKITRFSLVALRVGMGWLFFYAGITKVVDPNWTSYGFLTNVDFASEFYNWLALPGNIYWVDLLNEWGLTLIGFSLILGFLVRYSSFFGMIVMALYYIPQLSSFPYVGDHSFIVDDHFVYILVLGVLAATCAGNYFGVDKYLPTCGGAPKEEPKDIDYHL